MSQTILEPDEKTSMEVDETPSMQPKKIMVPVTFPLDNHNYQLIETARKIKIDNMLDCVISNLEILGIIDSYLADAFRITIKSGMPICDTEELINYIEKHRGGNKLYKIVIMPAIIGLQFLPIYCNVYMPLNSSIFTGIQYKNNEQQYGHVFLIVKNGSGEIYNIDLQRPERFCNLNTLDCYQKVYGSNLTNILLLTANFYGSLDPKLDQLLKSTNGSFTEC